MKRRTPYALPLTLLVMMWTTPLMAQTSIDAIYEFTGSTGCSNEDLAVTTQPSGATYSSMARGSVINCVNGTALFRNENFANGTTIDPETSNSYVAFTITADGGSALEFEVGDKLSLRALRHKTGANHGPRRLSVYYKRNTDISFTQLGSEVTTSTSWATYDFIYGSTLTVDAGGTIEFRIFGYEADGDQDLSLDDIQIVGASVLPVELTAFDALADGDAVVLTWKTASETNNAGFEVQIRNPNSQIPNENWEALAFVDGHGTTLEAQTYRYRLDGLAPGRYVFRLKQLDYDGAFDYSPEVEVAVEMPAGFLVEPAYPNPFNPQATLRFAVRQPQAVRVELFDVRGRRVRLLFAGVPAAGSIETVVIDGAGLPSGLYVVRVMGERFVQTQTLTLLK